MNEDQVIRNIAVEHAIKVAEQAASGIAAFIKNGTVPEEREDG